MLLKVGELARRSGLTVRTLHHYDAIGLLCPSARSEAGYRLYSEADVARLHGIQAMRHLGLSLRDVRATLAGEGMPMPALLARQVRALDRQIAQATELRGRLALLQGKYAEGDQPAMDDWLQTLALMASYGKYFSAAELKLIFENWKQVEAGWAALLPEVRAAMAQGLAPDAIEVQPLIHRWMCLMVRWMGGDMALMQRWGRMYDDGDAVISRLGPDRAMARWVTEAIEHRKAALQRYLRPEQMLRLGWMREADWQAFARDVQALARRRAPPPRQAAPAGVPRDRQRMDELTGGDHEMQHRLMLAYRDEPLLRATALLSPSAREFLASAGEAAEALSPARSATA
jgi:DNA-binding transcriptional MerR regulator